MLPTKIPFAGLSAAEIAELGNIGVTTISAAQWGYLGACGTGGGQLLAALTTAESTQVEAIGATTISAAQWGYLGALTSEPMEGDGTAGATLRGLALYIENGTDDTTLKCSTASRWNGDVIASTDNIGKGATVDDFSLSADGKNLTIEVSGLSGNVLFALASLYTNGTAVELNVHCVASGNDMLVQLLNTPNTPVAQDITTLVDTGNIYMNIFYITDA